MGSTVLTPAEVALHPRTHHQESPPPPSCPRKPTSSTPSPTPPSSSSRRPLALWMLTRMVSFPLLTWFPPLPLTARTLAVVRPRPCYEVDGPMNFTQMVTLFASKM